MIPSGRLNGYSVNTLRDVLVSSADADSTRHLEKVGKKLDDTKSEINKMVKRVNPGYAAPGSVSDIPLNPRVEDWEDKIPFWRKQRWMELRYGSRGPVTLDSCIASAFLEDEFGQAVSDEVRDAIYKDVRGFFADAYSDPGTRGKLGPYDKTGFRISEAFRFEIEGKYPFLRLCEGHWKVAQLWKNTWTSWAKNHVDPIIIHSDDENKVAIGKKRANTDDKDPGPSKKAKGKDVDRGQAPTDPPYKSRPKPIKTNAKAARVSRLIYICLHLYAHQKFTE